MNDKNVKSNFAQKSVTKIQFTKKSLPLISTKFIEKSKKEKKQEWVYNIYNYGQTDRPTSWPTDRLQLSAVLNRKHPDGFSISKKKVKLTTLSCETNARIVMDFQF